MSDLTMLELFTYTDSDFSDLYVLMQEISSGVVFTRESLERMLADAAAICMSSVKKAE